MLAEATCPDRVLHRGRRDHERPLEIGLVGDFGDEPGLRQHHTGGPVGAVQRLDRAVHDDRPDARVDAGEDALRLAEAVAEQQAGAAGSGVRGPPAVDACEQFALRGPTVDRQPEGALRDEAIATNRLEGLTGHVGFERVVGRAGHEVVTRGDPDPAAVLEPHLRRAEHVARGMQRDAHPEVVDALSIAQRLQIDLAEAGPQHALARCGCEVVRVACARMVGMGVRDHRARDWSPRVDVEVAGRAVEALGTQHDEVVSRSHSAS